MDKYTREHWLDIVSIIAKEAGFTLENLLRTNKRSKELSTARHKAFLLLYQEGYTYNEISDFFDCNHASVIYGARKAWEGTEGKSKD